MSAPKTPQAGRNSKGSASSVVPTVKCARFRLYDIEAVDDRMHAVGPLLRNKEGLRFRAPRDDVLAVGAFSKVRYVNKMELTDVLRLLDGFFWIRFAKKDGSVRTMYAMRMRERIAGNPSLRDLELPNTETRQCVISNILNLVALDTHFIVGKPPKAPTAARPSSATSSSPKSTTRSSRSVNAKRRRSGADSVPSPTIISALRRSKRLKNQ